MRRNLLILLVISLFGAFAGCGDNERPLNTIGDHVRADKRFTSLEGALRDTDLLTTLDGPGPYTLFAFVDGEFEPSDLPADTLQRLVGYHIHEGDLSVADLQTFNAASTLEGTEIHVRNGLDGILLNDGVKVSGAPIITENGTIHVLDRALSRTLFTSNVTVESPLDVPINGFFSNVLNLDAPGYIHGLQVFVDIQQEDVSQLFIRLRHVESGTFVELARSTGSRNRDMQLTFADGAPFDIVGDVVRTDDPTEDAFPEETYRAFEPLEYMLGTPLTGQWQLTVFAFGSEGESHIRSWGMIATVGEDLPAPAIVLNPRRVAPAAFARQFSEATTIEARRVGGLTGEVELNGSLGDLVAESGTIAEESNLGSIVFPVPEAAELGDRDGILSAQSGEVSRIATFRAAVVEPQASGMTLLSHVPMPRLAPPGAAGNDIWGWTDPMTGAEIALVGTTKTTAFVDVSVPETPVVLGTLATHTEASTWRDIKVYNDHAFIVSEAFGHGMQVFDLTQLRTSTENEVFEATAHNGDFGNAHNIAINEETGTAYVVGSDFEGCNGGMLVFDISTPINPLAIGCFSGGITNGQAGGPSYPTDVYTHDVQCVTYKGPDKDYQGREICFSSDEQSVGVVDFSDTANPSQIVRMTYDGVGYTHQGWLTEDHEFFIMNDEYDEITLGLETRSYIWDMRDLDAPELVGFIDNPSNAIGHNTYIVGDVAYQANYTSGLRLVDVSGIAAGETPEVAYYDTNPDDDAICRADDDCGVQSFDGAWSTYPFFESGTLLISDTQRGLFVVKRAVE